MPNTITTLSNTRPNGPQLLTSAEVESVNGASHAGWGMIVGGAAGAAVGSLAGPAGALLGFNSGIIAGAFIGDKIQ
jgi:hypothetical protein